MATAREERQAAKQKKTDHSRSSTSVIYAPPRKRPAQDAVPVLREALIGGPETFHVTVAEAGEQTVEVPREALRILVESIAHMESGRVVEIVTSAEELSTVQAAKRLGVSRPHLVGLLDKGVMRYRMVGTHRRVDVTSLEDYQRDVRLEQQRRAAVASATGSLLAEGLLPSAQSDRDVEAYGGGDASLDALIARTVSRYAQAEEPDAR